MKLKKADTLGLDLVIDDVDATLEVVYPVAREIVAKAISDNELLKEFVGQYTWNDVIGEATEGRLSGFSASVVDDHVEVNFDVEVTDDEVNDLVTSVNDFLDGSKASEPGLRLDCEINGKPISFGIWAISLAPKM